MALTIKLVCF